MVVSHVREQQRANEYTADQIQKLNELFTTRRAEWQAEKRALEARTVVQYATVHNNNPLWHEPPPPAPAPPSVTQQGHTEIAVRSIPNPIGDTNESITTTRVPCDTADCWKSIAPSGTEDAPNG